MRLRQTLLTAFAIMLLSAGMAQAQFYKSGIQMGSQYCPGVELNCDRLSSSQSAIVTAANQCIAQTHNIPSGIMSTFSSSGEFENCVLPGETYRDASGFTMWAICCVKKVDGADGCSLFCTRYTSPKK